MFVKSKCFQFVMFLFFSLGVFSCVGMSEEEHKERAFVEYYIAKEIAKTIINDYSSLYLEKIVQKNEQSVQKVDCSKIYEKYEQNGMISAMDSVAKIASEHISGLEGSSNKEALKAFKNLQASMDVVFSMTKNTSNYTSKTYEKGLNALSNARDCQKAVLDSKIGNDIVIVRNAENEYKQVMSKYPHSFTKTF